MDALGKPDESQPPPPRAEAVRAAGAVIWNSEEILKGTKEIQIVHRSEIYRLRLTRNGKLILSK
ncbi:MAG: hemin uptake protein HemP [Pirellulaceae bacterium]|nr:hemin uptake protein HemP [Pirellulaceae bacterium]